MLQTLFFWLPAIAFFGAGLFNAIGTALTQNDFVRWGYPRWWCRVTGGLEMVIAVLIAIPLTHEVGLVLGAVIVAAAVATVLRHRDFSHLRPLGAFAILLVLAEMTY